MNTVRDTTDLITGDKNWDSLIRPSCSTLIASHFLFISKIFQQLNRHVGEYQCRQVERDLEDSRLFGETNLSQVVVPQLLVQPVRVSFLSLDLLNDIKNL